MGLFVIVDSRRAPNEAVFINVAQIKAQSNEQRLVKLPLWKLMISTPEAYKFLQSGIIMGDDFKLYAASKHNAETSHLVEDFMKQKPERIILFNLHYSHIMQHHKIIDHIGMFQYDIVNGYKKTSLKCWYRSLRSDDIITNMTWVYFFAWKRPILVEHSDRNAKGF